MPKPKEDLTPRAVEAERAVLGSIMIDAEWAMTETEVVEILAPDDFFIERHAWIYQALLELYNDNRQIDFVTLRDKLDAQQQLDEIGGSMYITGLINAVPSAGNVEEYAKDIRNTARKRRLISAAEKIAKAGFNTEDAEDAMELAEAALYEAAEESQDKQMVSMAQAADDTYNELLEQVQSEGISGIPTGLKDLDKIIGGFQPDDMILIAGRPGMGKTALAGTIMYNVAKKGKKVALFSLEMNYKQVTQRLLARVTGINSQDIRLARLQEPDENPELWNMLAEERDKLKQLPMFIDDEAAISTVLLKTRARRLHRRHRLDLIIVDYLQLMRYTDRWTNRTGEITHISQQLKALARELGVPVVALSQLNRDFKSRTDPHPKISDLRGSGSLEQDADVILFLTRMHEFDEEQHLPSDTDLDIAKSRHGPKGRVQLYFHADTVYFSNAAAAYVDEQEPLEAGPEPEPEPVHLGGNGRDSYGQDEFPF